MGKPTEQAVRAISALYGVELGGPDRGAVKTVDLVEGDVLFSQGDAADAAYFVMSGEMDIQIDGESVGRLGVSQCFGELAVLQNKPRSGTAAATSTTTVLRIEGELFRQLHLENPELRDFLFTLKQAYQAPMGGVLTVHRSELDGMPAVTSVRVKEDGETILNTKVLGEDRMRMWRCGAQRGTTTMIRHDEPALDVSVILHMQAGKVVGADIQGAFDRPGLIYQAVATAEYVDDDERARFETRGRIHPDPTEVDTVDPVVCDCIGIRRSNVIEAVLAGAHNLERLAQTTTAGAMCGGCNGRLARVIDDAERMHCPRHVTQQLRRKRVQRISEVRDPAAAAALPKPPVALMGAQKIPILGLPARYSAIINDPIGLVVDAKEAYGPAVTISIPFKFDLVYVDNDLMQEILSLPAEVAGMGGVMGNVPTVGFWFERQGKDSDHVSLQKLLLAGKEAQRDLLAHGEPGWVEAVTEVAKEHISTWDSTIDLLEQSAMLFSDASCAAVVGRDLWNRLKDEALPLYRDIAEGIDVPRASLAVTPYHYAMPEYQSTRKLRTLLLAVLAEHESTGAYPVIDRLRKHGPDGGPLHDDDLAWMLMYVLWNASNYPGSYGSWTLADVVSHPEIKRKVNRIKNPATRLSLLADCFHETVRLSPVSSLVRALAEDVVITGETGKWRIPAGSVLGVLPWANFRDPEVFDDPLTWDPLRFRKMETFPALFGRGPFSCVATSFNRMLFSHTISAIFDALELEPIDEVPPRMCRVHLLYGKFPYRTSVTPRADA